MKRMCVASLLTWACVCGVPTAVASETPQRRVQPTSAERGGAHDLPNVPSEAPKGRAWTWPGSTSDPAVAKALQQPQVNALRREMERAMSELRLPQRQPPYFIAYSLLEVEQQLVVGQLGVVVQSEYQHSRVLKPEVRVGSPSLDNSHTLTEGGFGQNGASLPLDNDEIALRTAIWSATDNAYRAAIQQLEQKATQRASERELEERPADFSPAKPVQVVVSETEPLPEAETLASLARNVSVVLADYSEIQESMVTVAAWRLARTLLTSEGSLVVTPTRIVEVTIRCNTQADDGMPLSHEVTIFGTPDEAQLVASARELAVQLTELRNAPLAPDHYGPVLFSGAAAPQLMQELLSQSFVGTPVPGEGPLARKIKRRVMPTSVDVVDDPTLGTLGAEPLLGSYLVDEEGVPGERVLLVKRGVLQTLLMSRTPSKEQMASNGHGRTGFADWARASVSNLILTTSAPQTLAAQRRALVASGEPALEIERFAVREFATNGAVAPTVERAFIVTPDGKRTLVRGVVLGEMQVRDFRDVLSVGSSPTVYRVLQSAGGYSIPTTVVSPALLFEDVEIRKPKASPQLPKVIPKPRAASTHIESSL
jgi:TldD protein